VIGAVALLGKLAVESINMAVLHVAVVVVDVVEVVLIVVVASVVEVVVHVVEVVLVVVVASVVEVVLHVVEVVSVVVVQIAVVLGVVVVTVVAVDVVLSGWCKESKYSRNCAMKPLFIETEVRLSLTMSTASWKVMYGDDLMIYATTIAAARESPVGQCTKT